MPRKPVLKLTKHPMNMNSLEKILVKFYSYVTLTRSGYFLILSTVFYLQNLPYLTNVHIGYDNHMLGLQSLFLEV